MSLSFVPPTIVDGKPVVQLDDVEVERNNELWMDSLIVYVVGGDPLISYMENFIEKNGIMLSNPSFTSMRKDILWCVLGLKRIGMISFLLNH